MASAGNLQWKHAEAPHSAPPSALLQQPDHDGLAVIEVKDTGEIRDCSGTCEALFGYCPKELTGQAVSILLPQLNGAELVLDDRVHPRLAFLSRCAMPFEARRRDGMRFECELFINLLDKRRLVILVRRLDRTRG